MRSRGSQRKALLQRAQLRHHARRARDRIGQIKVSDRRLEGLGPDRAAARDQRIEPRATGRHHLIDARQRGCLAVHGGPELHQRVVGQDRARPLR